MIILRIKSGEFNVIQYRANVRVIADLHGVQTEVCSFCHKLFVVTSETDFLLDIKIDFTVNR
jgi:hypothetical protein